MLVLLHTLPRNTYDIDTHFSLTVQPWVKNFSFSMHRIRSTTTRNKIVPLRIWHLCLVYLHLCRGTTPLPFMLLQLAAFLLMEVTQAPAVLPQEPLMHLEEEALKVPHVQQPTPSSWYKVFNAYRDCRK